MHEARGTDTGRGVLSPRPALFAPIVVLTETRYLAHSQPWGLYHALRRRQPTVLLDTARLARDPQARVQLDAADAVVARGRSDDLLGALAHLEAAGVMTINSREAIAGVRDKADMARVLTRAGIPSPRTFLGPLALLAECISSTDFPLVVKPVLGDNCEGVVVVPDRAALQRLPVSDRPVLAQPYIPNDGWDVKLYGIGCQLWAVRKRSPLQPPDGCGVSLRPNASRMRLTPSLRRLGASCRELFGLELFGVDCVMGPEGPVVIEVNDFPNFSSVPDASDVLAAYVVARSVDWEKRCASLS
jgi:ribosomal protein S6--L-glutamate ligase